MKRQKGAMYVQYGCGFKAPREWRNFDASTTLKWERTPILGGLFTKNAQRFPSTAECGDIVKGLPVREESCRGVFASHVLEHLALDDFHQAIYNTMLILEKGGIFRLLVPDLESAARDYIASVECGTLHANATFLRSTGLGREKRARGTVRLLFEFFRTSSHLWMWDAPSLKHALAEHGFQNIRRCHFGDCADPMFNLVEDPGRFERAVAMEATR
jgi:predicted SAM-dependent methyltransferase